MARYLLGGALAIIIIPPMLIAAAIWDVNQHWKQAAFDWPEDDDDV